MTALEVEHTIDFSDMSDGILEEHKVHLDQLRLSVVGLKFFNQVLSQLVELGAFLIDSHVLIQEINEDGVISISHAVFLVVQLELKLQLLVEVQLKLIAILERVKAVVEDSEDFMSPELHDLLLALIEILVGLVETLEDLGDISHVEDVVTLGWGRQEVLLDDVEKVDCCQSEGLAKVLNLLIEDLELEGSDGLEDLLHLSLCWDGIVHNVELGHQTL
jgi:hypothetical protein